MEQRDWYLKEVQKFAAILARLLGLKNEGRLGEASSLIEDTCRNLTGLAAQQLAQLSDEALLALITFNELTKDQVEALAELLAQEGELLKESGNMPESLHQFRRAVFLLNYLTQSRKEYSFEREQRLNALNRLIGEVQGVS